MNVANRTCACGFWELVGIPCRHAVATLGYRHKNPEQFVDECYSRKSYELCYENAISAINGKEMWTEVESEEILPPNYKSGLGRPKKPRIREFDENGGRMRRPGVTYRCTKCDKISHNKRKCKSDVQHPEAAKRQVNLN